MSRASLPNFDPSSMPHEMIAKRQISDSIARKYTGSTKNYPDHVCSSVPKDPLSTITKSNIQQHIYIPRKTDDYVIKKWGKGLGLYANRNISEGENIFENSIQYTITDVEDGDYVLFHINSSSSPISSGLSLQQHKHHIKKKLPPSVSLSQRKRMFNVVPDRLPVEADLIFTHGIPVLSKDPSGESSGIISHHVNIPAMLMNHSCDPNIIHDGGDHGHELHLAVRDIREGEELTMNYSLIYYDEGPIHHKCLCESENCCGQILGFKDLDFTEKDTLLPFVSPAVHAMLREDLKNKMSKENDTECRDDSGSKVEEDCKTLSFVQPLVAERVSQAPMYSMTNGLRMVCPNPSSCNADIAVRVNMKDSSDAGIFAFRDFQEGEIVYTFWMEDWPMMNNGRTPANIDMVFPTAMAENDPVEGTSIWLDPTEYAKKDSDGKFKFTGFDLLVEHSCDPNIVYEQTKLNENNRWQATYAARNIMKGEKLTSDLNSMLWDRSQGLKIVTCSCGEENCAGTTKGFKYLSVIKQKQRWVERSNGRHLSPLVRAHCKLYDRYYHELVGDYDSEDRLPPRSPVKELPQKKRLPSLPSPKSSHPKPSRPGRKRLPVVSPIAGMKSLGRHPPSRQPGPRPQIPPNPTLSANSLSSVWDLLYDASTKSYGMYFSTDEPSYDSLFSGSFSQSDSNGLPMDTDRNLKGSHTISPHTDTSGSYSFNSNSRSTLKDYYF